ERMLSQSSTSARSRDVFGLRCLPGECVLQRTVMVRKKLTAREGRGWLSGTLFCTHFRVAFVPQDSPKSDDNADPILLGDHDVALASIEKVVAVGPNRTKLVTPNSSLKFTPEELVLYCRDLRVMCFLFDRLTPDAQVIEITYTIAKTYQPLKPGSVLSFQNAALGSVGKWFTVYTHSVPFLELVQDPISLFNVPYLFPQGVNRIGIQCICLHVEN
ncbi:hypothetical protein AMECASPLE_018500, partial [Ameca splendens]